MNNNDYNPQDIIAAYVGVDQLTSYEVEEWRARAQTWSNNPTASDPAYAVIMMAASAL